MKKNNFKLYKDLGKKGTSLLIALLLLLPPAPFALAETGTQDAEEATLIDHEATVFGVSGDVQILRKSTGEWEPLQEEDSVLEGDSIRTAKDSYAEITYDAYHLNTVRVEEDTTIEFRSIEETELYISTGSVFNDLGGQLENSEYQLSTPVSVAAVRGTQFLRSYNPDTLEDETSVIEGSVEVAPFDPTGRPNFAQSFQVNQDKALRFDREMIQNRNFRRAKVAEIAQDKRARLHKVRQASRNRLQKFAGGEARFRKAQERLHNLKRNPGASQRLRNQMRPQGQRFRKNQNSNNPNFRGPNQNRARFQQRTGGQRNPRAQAQQLRKRNWGPSQNPGPRNNRQNQFSRNPKQRNFQGPGRNQGQGPRKPQGQRKQGARPKNQR